MGKKIYSRCHLAMLEKVEPPSAPASWTEKVEAPLTPAARTEKHENKFISVGKVINYRKIGFPIMVLNYRITFSLEHLQYKSLIARYKKLHFTDFEVIWNIGKLKTFFNFLVINEQNLLTARNKEMYFIKIWNGVTVVQE